MFAFMPSILTVISIPYLANLRSSLAKWVECSPMGSIPGCIIPKTLKMVLDTTLLNTQHYKVRIKGSGAIQEKE